MIVIISIFWIFLLILFFFLLVWNIDVIFIIYKVYLVIILVICIFILCMIMVCVYMGLLRVVYCFVMRNKKWMCKGNNIGYWVGNEEKVVGVFVIVFVMFFVCWFFFIYINICLIID